MYFVLRKWRHNFDKLRKFLGKKDLFLLASILRDDLKQILLILILSYDVKMSSHPQHNLLYIFIIFFAEFSYYFYQLFLVGPKIQAFKDLLQDCICLFAQFFFGECAQHIEDELQENEGLVAMAKILHQCAETTDDSDSHIHCLLHECFHQKRHQLLTDAFGRQYQGNSSNFLHCLPLQVFLLELLIEESDRVNDQRFASPSSSTHCSTHLI